MKIYNVYRLDKIGWDEYEEFVVIAKDEKTAREMCAKNHADEGKEIWLSDKVHVEIVDAENRNQAIVCKSFNAG
jgi:hypothetical protein